MVRQLVELWEQWAKGEIMHTTRKVKNSSDRRTGAEKEVEYTLQNGEDSWFQELLNEFPTLRSRSNVVKRRLAE